MFAPVYHQMAEQTGWNPRVVDGLYVWEVAVMLGVGSPRPAVPMNTPVSVER